MKDEAHLVRLDSLKRICIYITNAIKCIQYHFGLPAITTIDDANSLTPLRSCKYSGEPEYWVEVLETGEKGAREGEQETAKGDFPGHPSCLGWNSTFEISPSHCQPLQIYQKLRSVETKANHHHPNILGSGRWQDTLGTGVHGCNWQDERAHQSFPKCWGCEHFWGHRFLRMENCVTIKQNMTKGGQTSLQCTFQK